MNATKLRVDNSSVIWKSSWRFLRVEGDEAEGGESLMDAADALTIKLITELLYMAALAVRSKTRSGWAAAGLLWPVRDWHLGRSPESLNLRPLWFTTGFPVFLRPSDLGCQQ
jgi:hypothetical protein